MLPGASFAKKPVSQEKIPEPGQIVFVDNDGVMIGGVQNIWGSEGRIYFDVDGKFHAAYLEDGTFYAQELYYDQAGCVGNVYTGGPDIGLGIEFITGGREGVLYALGGDTPQTVEVLSLWSDYGYSCYRFGNVYCDSPERFNCLNVLDFQPEPEVFEAVYPAVPIIDTNIYTKPFRLKLTPPD